MSVTITGVLRERRRLLNTASGNPQFMLTLELDGQSFLYRTEPDAAVALRVDGLPFDRPIKLTLNGDQRIIDVADADTGQRVPRDRAIADVVLQLEQLRRHAERVLASVDIVPMIDTQYWQHRVDALDRALAALREV